MGRVLKHCVTADPSFLLMLVFYTMIAVGIFLMYNNCAGLDTPDTDDATKVAREQMRGCAMGLISGGALGAGVLQYIHHKKASAEYDWQFHYDESNKHHVTGYGWLVMCFCFFMAIGVGGSALGYVQREGCFQGAGLFFASFGSIMFLGSSLFMLYNVSKVGVHVVESERKATHKWNSENRDLNGQLGPITEQAISDYADCRRERRPLTDVWRSHNRKHNAAYTSDAADPYAYRSWFDSQSGPKARANSHRINNLFTPTNNLLLARNKKAREEGRMEIGREAFFESRGQRPDGSLMGPSELAKRDAKYARQARDPRYKLIDEIQAAQSMVYASSDNRLESSDQKAEPSTRSSDTEKGFALKLN